MAIRIKGRLSVTARKMYERQWGVPSSTGKREYTVSKVRDDGSYQCSCPAWVHRRRECRHIAEVKLFEAERQRELNADGESEKIDRAVEVESHAKRRQKDPLRAIASNAKWRRKK